MKKVFKKNKILFTSALFLMLLVLCVFIFYSNPILLNINPFYTYTEVHIDDSDAGPIKDISRRDITSQIKSELPKEWSLVTTNMEIQSGPYHAEDYVVTGLASVRIYKQGNLVARMHPAGGVGAMGFLLYKFPDFDPMVYASVIELGDDSLEIIEVEDGGYTEIEILEIKTRRVGNRYIPARGVNPDENKLFGSYWDATTPVFYFDDPNFKYCLNAESFTCGNDYGIDVKEGVSEEDLLILDAILNSMRSRL